ncbi:MAG: DUF2291 domain-containing protein [Micrococcales bacterium]|nr:DUF2291 domain-containing protein [Micrococcales bacterium]
MPTRKGASRRWVKRAITVGVVAVLVAGMLLNTKFISSTDSEAYAGHQFSAEEYANENFESDIVPAVLTRAVPATELYAQLETDLDEAGAAHGGRDGTSAWGFPVTFQGVAGEANEVNGQMPVTVDGLPDTLSVLVQMGPPIIGTALRDVTGQISFGMFINQTEFQQVAQAFNQKVRESVLQESKAADLVGKTVEVTGAFSADKWETVWMVVPLEIKVVQG